MYDLFLLLLLSYMYCMIFHSFRSVHVSYSGEVCYGALMISISDFVIRSIRRGYNKRTVHQRRRARGGERCWHIQLVQFTLLCFHKSIMIITTILLIIKTYNNCCLLLHESFYFVSKSTVCLWVCHANRRLHSLHYIWIHIWCFWLIHLDWLSASYVHVTVSNILALYSEFQQFFFLSERRLMCSANTHT